MGWWEKWIESIKLKEGFILYKFKFKIKEQKHLILYVSLNNNQKDKF